MKKVLKICFLLMLCSMGSSCVQKEHEKTITFTVDMSEIEVLGPVGIRGQFPESNWQKTIEMVDANGDSIYELTIQDKTAINNVEFKFVNGNDYELRGADNRVLKFEYKPERIMYEAIFNDPNGKQTSK